MRRGMQMAMSKELMVQLKIQSFGVWSRVSKVWWNFVIVNRTYVNGKLNPAHPRQHFGLLRQFTVGH